MAKKLKIVKLQAGFGNQMFQYAFGKALEHKLGTKVLFDKSGYDELQKQIVGNTGKNADGICIRKYTLGIFNLDIDFATPEQVKECIGEEKTVKSKVPGEIRKIFKLPKYKEITNRIREKSDFIYDETLFKDYKKAYYEGYFQNEKYFKDIEPFIRKSFILPEIRQDDDYNKALFDKVCSAENSVFIHVRRDDYLTLNWEIGNDYYKQAAKYIAERIENPKFFVFCAEDENYIKNDFDLGFPFELIGEKNKTDTTYYENMRLMMACKHSIIANSSYSWWAAWLGEHKDKIVIAPTPWLLEKDDIICDNWIKINRKGKYE